MTPQSIEGAMPPLPEPDHYLWEHKHGDVAPQLSSNTGPHPDFEVTPLFEKYQLVALLARVAELEKDAARYRWLRDDAPAYAIRPLCDLPGRDWDAAIDAALAAHKDQP